MENVIDRINRFIRQFVWFVLKLVIVLGILLGLAQRCEDQSRVLPEEESGSKQQLKHEHSSSSILSFFQLKKSDL